MKIEWNSKYTTIAVYTVLTSLAILLLVTAVIYFPEIASIFSLLNDILMPVWLGLVFAYLMNPILRFIETHVLRFKIKNKHQKNLKRAIGIVLTFIVVLIMITILALLIIPQVYVSFMDLISKLSGYLDTTIKLIEDFTAELDILLSDSLFSDYIGQDVNNVGDLINKYLNIDNIFEQLESLLKSLPGVFSENFPKFIDYFSGIANSFLNVLLGIFFSVYFLASKEKLIAQLKKLFRSVAPKKLYHGVLELCSFTDKTFGGFITGKLLDSLIIGILCWVVCAICKMPYALLISVFVGVTNVIPVVGPIIGAIPGFFIIFIVDPIKALWFVLIIVIIQQLDGNVIGPKILGQTTGISALWVLFSITVMGSLAGFLGMIIAVPMFAVIYSLIKIAAEKRLHVLELPTDTAAYYSDAEDRELPDDEGGMSFVSKLKKLTADAASNPLGKRIASLRDKLKKKK